MASTISDPPSDLLKQLQKLKLPELKALCKQAGIKGYSKSKHAVLVEKILAVWTTTGVPVGAPLPPKVPVHQSRQHPPTSAGTSSSVNNVDLTSPIFTSDINTPSNTSSDTILVTPATLPTSLTAIHESPLKQSNSLSSLNSKKQPSIQPVSSSHPENPISGLSSNVIATQPSTQDIRKGRDDERRQAAVSLKDVAAKQRGTKRAADPKSSQLQGRVDKKVATGTTQSTVAAAQSSNALQLHNMQPATNTSVPRSMNDVFNTVSSVSPLPTSLSSALGSSALRSSALNSDQGLSNSANLPSGYTLAPPTGPDPSVGSVTGANLDTTLAPAIGSSISTASSKTFPTRTRNPKRAPIRKSVVPDLPQLASTSLSASQVPHLPLGTAPLLSTTKMAANLKSNAVRKHKKRPVGNFVTPAFVETIFTQKSSTPAVETFPCREEPLLSGPAAIGNNIQGKLRLKQEAIARIKKSWLTRFHDQLAAARRDVLGNDPTIACSRSPTGLPGMTADFVHSATTGPEQLDIAVVFVIARLHTQIGTDDWQAIVKDEPVLSVTKIGGGIWRVLTRTQLRDFSKGDGVSSALKTEITTYVVLGDTGEILVKGDEKSLRQDWRLYLSENSNGSEKNLMISVKTKDDIAYPHGIAAGWSKITGSKSDTLEVYRLAEKFVLSNVMPNSYSGEYQSALQMEASWMGQGSLAAQPRRPQVNLYLPESHQVECVALTTSGFSGRALHPSIMIVKRKSTENLVLRETGQIIGNCEEDGVLKVWRCLIGCDHRGVALSEVQSKRISDQFWTGWDVASETA